MAEFAPTSYDELASVMESLPLLVREKRRRDQLSLREAAAAMTLSAATAGNWWKFDTPSVREARARARVRRITAPVVNELERVVAWLTKATRRRTGGGS